MSTKRATDSESISTVPAPGIRGYQVVLSLAEREATEKITALRMRQIVSVMRRTVEDRWS